MIQSSTGRPLIEPFLGVHVPVSGHTGLTVITAVVGPAVILFLQRGGVGTDLTLERLS